MIPADLIDVLRCPRTGQPLVRCQPELVTELNGRIARHGFESVRNQGGATVKLAMDDGLIRSDGAAVYPVRGGIAVLLADEAITLPLP